MKVPKLLRIFLIYVTFSLCFSLPAKAASPAGGVPEWNIGDTWQFRIQKELDRTVTEGGGVVQITMRLNRVESVMTYTVTEIADAEGEQCYILSVKGSQKISGSYNTVQLQGEAAVGTLVQEAAIEGKECRRTTDLAFVRAELKSTGNIRLGGTLGGAPTTFESHAITVASPPAQVFNFPLDEGKKWRVSSTLSTTSTGTTSDSIITTFNYECEVLGSRTITLEDGDSYECIAISQKGTQTTQSQNSGLNIENINGSLFFAPSVGNRVRDEAEGEELVMYTEGSGSAD